MIILNVNVNQIILQDSTSWTTHKVERHAGKDGNLLLYNCKNYQVRSYFYKFIVKQRKEGVPRSESYYVRIESGERMENGQATLYSPIWSVDGNIRNIKNPVFICQSCCAC